MSHPLRRYREQHEVGLAVLAARAGTTPSSLSRIERGKQRPSLDLISRLVDATGGVLAHGDFFPPSSPAAGIPPQAAAPRPADAVETASAGPSSSHAAGAPVCGNASGALP